jgi:DNA-binding IscR family transcriptional regulator
MEQGIFLCPFSQRASMTFLFSWMFSVQENQEVDITPHELLDKAQSLGLHPTTLKRQIDSLTKNKYFSLQKRGGGYTLTRSSLSPSYLALSLKSSFFKKHSLRVSEAVLFSAILILQKKGRSALTRKALAGRTGFSLRQVCYSLQSLKKKGLLVYGVQQETYVRHTQVRIAETVNGQCGHRERLPKKYHLHIL